MCFLYLLVLSPTLCLVFTYRRDINSVSLWAHISISAFRRYVL